MDILENSIFFVVLIHILELWSFFEKKIKSRFWKQKVWNIKISQKVKSLTDVSVLCGLPFASIWELCFVVARENFLYMDLLVAVNPLGRGPRKNCQNDLEDPTDGGCCCSSFSRVSVERSLVFFNFFWRIPAGDLCGFSYALHLT